MEIVVKLNDIELSIEKTGTPADKIVKINKDNMKISLPFTDLIKALKKLDKIADLD